MSVCTVEEPRILHELKGRMRVHVPIWEGNDAPSNGREVRDLSGVRRVMVNSVTGNALILFDPRVVSPGDIVSTLARLVGKPDESRSQSLKEKPRPSVLREHHGRARITVQGIDRDPGLARTVVDRLQAHPGVKARANPLTGRVLVEFDEHRADLDDLVAEITGLEFPEVPGTDQPAHPLDPAPLRQSATHTAGAAMGLIVLAARRLAGEQGPPISNPTPAVVASIIGILQGYPATRNGLRAVLGRNMADLLVQGASIVTMVLSGSPLGLALSGGEALRLLTEVVPRRAAWRRYEERLGDAASAQPGTTIRLEAGERVPLKARVVEGMGTAVGEDGLPRRVAPGETVSAGARLGGGPFVLALTTGEPFTPEPRPAPLAPDLQGRYARVLAPISLAYAALTAVTTRSLSRTFNALLLVSPRAALIGADEADLGASARVLRAGVTVVGTRPDRAVRLPDLLLLSSSRVLTDGYEVRAALPATDAMDSAEILARAAGIAAAVGSPWGGCFPVSGAVPAQDGSFDGDTATAFVDGVRHTLGPFEDDAKARAVRPREQGTHPLALRSENSGLLGIITLRPRLASGVGRLVATCNRHGVELAVLSREEGDPARVVPRRAKIEPLEGSDPVTAIRARQSVGAFVAFVSDSADGAEAFAASDLAIGLSSGRHGRFPARADLLSPDLAGLAAIVEAGARRNLVARDSVALSVVGNVVGAAWGFRGTPGIQRASQVVQIAALGTLVDGWLRLRGGLERGAAAWARDPHPERWGRYSPEEALHILGTTRDGLSHATAQARCRDEPRSHERSAAARAVLDQLRSPLAAILGVGAGLALILSAPFDVAIIGATLGVNVAVGAWQERRAGQATEALAKLSAPVARVVRDGEIVAIPAADVVPGDLLVVRAGDRVAADARLLEATNLEVDEAVLTGESLPVAKRVEGGPEASRVLLDGSDVTVGTGRAVVFAVGRGTRMGATAAALSVEEPEDGALGARLVRMMRQVLPLAAAGGAIVVGSGLVRGRPLPSQLAIGATIAIAAVPEGLPLLTAVGQGAVARRLAERHAVVRRLNAVEALGRVAIACTDKTGTLTEGRLALTLVADLEQSCPLKEADAPVSGDLREVLRAAALASPHPDRDDAMAHPTDMAIVRGAQDAGLGEDLRAPRTAEVPFDPIRSFHAAAADGQLFVKGAAEALIPRCTAVWRDGAARPLDNAGRQSLRGRAEELAAQGLRVLFVARGAVESSVSDPQDLVALGYVGISDPLRPGVPEAVRRCREAGIRVIMLTGDHPATARAIAGQAGVLRPGDGVLTGMEIADLHNGDLDRRLAGASVIARVTPLDKVRIVESLRRQGHTIAMTGDGVNDAPALRLADVGVAMGRDGTEVARQAADVVLGDDNFATLVEALVEGRSFWGNVRRALGLLLGGNLGELGLVVGASILGLSSPLVTRQILAVNLITDALPALAVALQRPAHRNLAELAREGAGSLDKPLRDEVLRRGAITAVPSLAAYMFALGASGLPQARTVAFASVVATQLAQTLGSGRSETWLSGPVPAAVAGSGGLLVAALTMPPLRELLVLAVPTPLGWTLIGASTLAALAASLMRAGSNGAAVARDPLIAAPQRLSLAAALVQP